MPLPPPPLRPPPPPPPPLRILVKLGGAAITAKDANAFECRNGVIVSALQQIVRARTALPQLQVILVCGVGPFGHTNVVKYSLRDAVFTDVQKEGLKVTREACDSVGNTVSQIAQSLGLDTVLIPAYIVARQINGRILSFDTQPFLDAIARGQLPITTGTMVPDTALHASVLSGDESIAQLARLWQPHRVLLGTDVAGIFTHDPNRDAHATLIPYITRANIGSVLEGAVGESNAEVDVTGGMQGKLEKLAKSIGNAIGFVFWLRAEGPQLLFDGLVHGDMETCTIVDMK
ncbi:Aspartate/glutamate/uridylate kinase [Chytriomyces sp. MP71]|nr:Aspartate/glutamate/uridylate kinase [Chytriomyces sp. MP71]